MQWIYRTIYRLPQNLGNPDFRPISHYLIIFIDKKDKSSPEPIMADPTTIYDQRSITFSYDHFYNRTGVVDIYTDKVAGALLPEGISGHIGELFPSRQESQQKHTRARNGSTRAFRQENDHAIDAMLALIGLNAVRLRL